MVSHREFQRMTPEQQPDFIHSKTRRQLPKYVQGPQPSSEAVVQKLAGMTPEELAREEAEDVFVAAMEAYRLYQEHHDPRIRGYWQSAVHKLRAECIRRLRPGGQSA